VLTYARGKIRNRNEHTTQRLQCMFHVLVGGCIPGFSVDKPCNLSEVHAGIMVEMAPGGKRWYWCVHRMHNSRGQYAIGSKCQGNTMKITEYSQHVPWHERYNLIITVLPNPFDVRCIISKFDGEVPKLYAIVSSIF
jgi:hypothetical protein